VVEHERKVLLSNHVVVPVISIERSNDGPFPDDMTIKRSISLSALDKPLPSEPKSPQPLLKLLCCLLRSLLRLVLRFQLSCHIEVDNSGVSKNVTASASPTPECDVDASALDLLPFI